MQTAVKVVSTEQVSPRFTALTTLIPRKYTPLSNVASLLAKEGLIRLNKPYLGKRPGVAYSVA